jgi:hypothetical protein
MKSHLCRPISSGGKTLLILLVLPPDVVDEWHAADHVGHPVEALMRRNDGPPSPELAIIAISVCGENAFFTRRCRIDSNVESMRLVVRRSTDGQAGKS